jgi:hypothetical protein
MGSEVLTTGDLRVERPDNNMLLEIKRGEWSLEKVQKEADRLFQLLDEALVRSELPSRINTNFVNDLCASVMMEFYGVYEDQPDYTKKVLNSDE